MDSSGIAKMLRSEQQLPSVSSETSHEPQYSMHESEVNEENKALATHGNSALGGFGGKTRNNSALFFSPFSFLNCALLCRAFKGQRNNLLIGSTD